MSDDPTIRDVLVALDKLRADIMERIDRLQDSMMDLRQTLKGEP